MDENCKNGGGSPSGTCRETTRINDGLSAADTHYLQLARDPSGFLTTLRICRAESPEEALRDARLFAARAKMDHLLTLPMWLFSEAFCFVVARAAEKSFQPVICEGMSRWFVKSEGETVRPFHTRADYHTGIDWRATEMKAYFGAVGDNQQQKVMLQLVLALNHRNAAAGITAAASASNQQYLCTIGLNTLTDGVAEAVRALRRGRAPTVLIPNLIGLPPFVQSTGPSNMS